MKTEKEERYMTLPIFYIVLSAIPFFCIFIASSLGVVWWIGDVADGIDPPKIFLYYPLKEITFSIFLTVVSFFFMRWMNKQMFGSLFNFLASVVVVATLSYSGMHLSVTIASSMTAIFSKIGENSGTAETIGILIGIFTIFFVMLFYWLGIPFLSVYHLRRNKSI